MTEPQRTTLRSVAPAVARTAEAGAWDRGHASGVISGLLAARDVRRAWPAIAAAADQAAG
jgi:hypothetical protein